MLAALLAIGVHVEELADTPLELAEALTSSLAIALRDRTGTPPSIDTLDWPACTGGDRCLDEIRARLRATDVVLLRYFTGPTMIRVVAHRMRENETAPNPAIELDVPKNRAQWREQFVALSAQLYPDVKATTETKLVEASPSATPSELNAMPWIVLGASAAVLAAGIVFGVQSANTADRIRGEFHVDRELGDLQSRMRAQAFTANVLFIVAAIGGATGVTLAILD